jgi:2'-5' RNA ligase
MVMESEFKRTGVCRLPWIEKTGRYESALVFDLPETLAEQILRARQALDVSYPPEHQLAPHLTLLYLGHMNGAQLLQLWEHLSVFKDQSVVGRLDGIDSFHSGNRVINLHFKVRRDPVLRELHERAYHLCQQFPWFNPGPFVNSGYQPHISFLDRIDIPESQLPTLGVNPTLPEEIRLVNPHMIAKRLD